MNPATALLGGVRIDRTSKGLPWVPPPVPMLEQTDAAVAERTQDRVEIARDAVANDREESIVVG